MLLKTPQSSKNQRARLARLSAAVEPLERRLLLTAVVVNTTADVTDPAGSAVVSLRDAVNIANSSTTPTTITFSATVFGTARTIALNGHVLELSGKQPVTITGPAAGVTVNGKNSSTDFLVGPGVTAAISSLTLTEGGGGNLYGGGIANYGSLTLNQDTITHSVVGYNGIDNAGTLVANNITVSDNNAGSEFGGLGGGINNQPGAHLTLTNSTISGNSAIDSGGIYNGGTANLTGVTISGNSSGDTASPGGVSVGGDGGIGNVGTMTLTNCTVSGNSTGYAAGGIGNFGILTLTNSTVSGNTASSQGQGPFGYFTQTPGAGGGLFILHAKSTVIQNSIIAGNKAVIDADVDGAVQSSGHNLIGQTNGSSGWTPTDLTGTSAKPLNALLSPLGSFGGPTQSMAPMTGSPAIDHGSNALVPAGLTTDQRGLPRIANKIVDIGAVEVQPSNSHFAVKARANLTATEGGSYSLSPASFSETGGGGPYTVQVNWGDGTTDNVFAVTSAGAVPRTPHTFAEEGTYHGVITIFDEMGHNSAATPFTVKVADAPLSGSAGAPLTGLAAGAPLAFQAAAFSDANPNSTISEFSASINWGDGTTSAGTVASQALGTTTGPYGVTGTHTYAKAGTFKVTVTVADVGGAKRSLTSSITCVTAKSVVVNTTKDQVDPTNSATVSLRDAVALADNSTGATAITFDPRVFATAQTIALNGSPLALTGQTTISIVAPSAGLTIDGKYRSDVFDIGRGVRASLSGLAITQGHIGVSNAGISFLTNCSVTSSNFGGVNNSGGSMFLTGVTVSGNRAQQGGGIENNDGAVTLIDSTIANNTARVEGGGIDSGSADGQAMLSVYNSTISGNTANVNTNGHYGPSGGVGINNGGTFITANSIIAGNVSNGNAPGPDVFGFGTIDSLGFNLVGQIDGSGWISTDLTGTLAKPLNAMLGALANNGGLTQTLLPLMGSPAIDHGSNALVPPGITTDQRGLPRIVNGAVDIGAVEVRASQARIVVTARSGLTATEGGSYSLSAGSFTETGAVGPYTADVNWGDGTPDSIFSVPAPGALPRAPHTYAEEGTYHGVVTVFDGTGTSSAPTPFTVKVADAPLSGSASALPQVPARVPFGLQLAAFSDADPNGLVSDYVATVNWGDGTSSAGAVASVNFQSTAGSFVVTGAHTYAKAGVYKLTVTVADAGGSMLVLSSNVTCVNAKPVLVNTTQDQTDPAGSKTISLRDAIAMADASTVPIMIGFDPSVFATGKTITLNTSLPDLSGPTPVSIVGPSAGVTIGGNNQFGLLFVDQSASASFSRLTFTGGSPGITNSGASFLTDCSIIGNIDQGYGGGISAAQGSMVLTGVTISGNQSSYGGGINIGIGAGLTLVDSTVANNTADFGGGIEADGALTLLDSTVVGNSASDGGGIDVEGRLTAGNSIIAGNNSNDVATFGTPVNSLGFNLIGATDGSSGWISSDLTGTSAKPLNPKLGPLSNNGGPTQTLLPLSGSPAINHGSNALVPAGLTTDQRGLSRIVGGTVDIGAVEV
jgi:hypothetical protein